MEKIDETSFPNRKSFYSNLNFEGICDYHELYVQSNNLLSADILENFQSSYLKTYNLDPAHIYSALSLANNNCCIKNYRN